MAHQWPNPGMQEIKRALESIKSYKENVWMLKGCGKEGQM